MNRTWGSRLLSGLIVVLTVIGTVIMLTNNEEGILTVYGLHNLKFFTVESNLLIGIIHLMFLIHSALTPSGQNEQKSLWIERLLYIATVAVSLTFAVVMLFFGPTILRPTLTHANMRGNNSGGGTAMSYMDEIMERRKNSVFREDYAAHGPMVVQHEGKCFCCGRTFDYLDALNKFEEYVEQRKGSFFAMDSFKGEICAECAIRTLGNRTWMEIL